MKYVKQFMIVLFISFLGEVLKYVLPFPVPASIYGLVLLFLCLETGLLRLSAVEDTAKYLVEIMPLMLSRRESGFWIRGGYSGQFC